MVPEQRSDGVTVPGLRNIGSTCYAAAVLQALASCSSLIQQLQLACRTLHSDDPAALSFTSALLDCLLLLQPIKGASAPSRSPAAVLHALRQRIGHAVLSEGQENDAAEAYEVMLGVVSSELQAAFASSAQMQLQYRGSLAAVLPSSPSPCCSAAGLRCASCTLPDCSQHSRGLPTGAVGPAPSTPGLASEMGTGQLHPKDLAVAPGTCTAAGAANSSVVGAATEDAGPPSLGQDCALSRQKGAVQQGVGGGPCSRIVGVGNGAGQTCLRHDEPGAQGASGDMQDGADCSEARPALAGDQVLGSWRSLTRLVCQGSLASQMTCLSCRHRFACQVSPFLSLPLSIPVAPGQTLTGNLLAAWNTSLERCLEDYLGFEVVQGVECTRCSLNATLANNNDRIHMQRYADSLKSRGVLLESDRYKQIALNAGLSWTPVDTSVAKCYMVAQLPRLLSVQLKRVVWNAAGESKISGHVRFSSMLYLNSDVLSFFGQSDEHKYQSQHLPSIANELSPSHSSQEAGQAVHSRQMETAGDSHAFKYKLCAVVVHYGIAGSGHYTVYRLSTIDNVDQWQRVSDEIVQNNICLNEVLLSEATLLLYELATSL